mmetsp:Transcript_13/g.51  ORF Transcript_13/g.51 Transcript_13/m.51 type:complete len:335 (+) Transcript_13:71-1075(+)
MGTGQSTVEVKLEDAEGFPAEMGLKIVRSAPFGDQTTFDKFFPALVETLKTDFKKMPNFKDGGMIERGEHTFETICNVDLSQAGGPPDHVMRNIYRVDMASGVIMNESRPAFGEVLLSCGITRVTRDPLRVEFSRQLPNMENRHAGPEVAGVLKGVLSAALGRDCTVKEGQKSLADPNLEVAMSEPLDDFADKDTVFDKVLGRLKDQRGSPFIDDDKEAQIVQESAPEEETQTYVVAMPLSAKKLEEKGLPAIPEGMKPVTPVVVKANKKVGLAAAQYHFPNAALAKTDVFTVLSEPLRVEACSYGAHPPSCDEGGRKIVETCLHAALERALNA